MSTYCPGCGTRLERQQAFGQERPVCPSCGHVHFDDPKVATGVVITDGGRILLTRRAHEPMLGSWSFPSGYVDSGEVVEEAAVREVEEETGVQVAIDRLLGVYSAKGQRLIFVAYAGHVTGGELRLGDESLEVGYFGPDELPELAFPHDAAIMEAWWAAHRTAAGRTCP